MKLLAILRAKINEEQRKTSTLFAKQLGFKSLDDTTTVIERSNCAGVWKWIAANKQLLIDSYPKEMTKKLRTIEINEQTLPSDILVVFKQVLRAHRSRLISRKDYSWSSNLKRQKYTLQYKILSEKKVSNTTVPDTSVVSQPQIEQKDTLNPPTEQPVQQVPKPPPPSPQQTPQHPTPPVQTSPTHEQPQQTPPNPSPTDNKSPSPVQTVIASPVLDVEGVDLIGV
eukprot:g14658.t1